ncbi:hypothetical protein IGB42_00368 [Andreprevotia sp. IGB-42]|uniref:type VI secretion system baseplate subunit TssF n=1 Tax=Andreprevotia sp. IGB-42 TaxID=2497473 RepID=UPI0013581A51|nr:type VI secretion system baseplate subunit TssF [Andreprevotia sp. IGB-42]KAF0815287.1 hypothetical protein IGB42_00368 [Andreprevotia sp. IGB-42]
MNVTDVSLKDFFVRELQSLRDDASEFGRLNPAAGHALSLGRGASGDPQVELLLQSFAWLAGRLRYQVETGLAAVPNFLNAFIYPHLSLPIPSMLIAQLEIKPDGANFTRENLLKRERMFGAMARNDLHEQYKCRFRTSCDTQLLPLHISQIQLLGREDLPLGVCGDNTASILRVRVQRSAAESLKTLNCNRLRIHIKSDRNDAFRLYEWFALNSYETGANTIAICPDGNSAATQRLPVGSFSWAGFEDDEALLEVNQNTHPGMRLLQEYFAFPEKFFFFDLHQLPLDTAQDSFDLLFFSTIQVDKTLGIRADSLLLNCVPLVNLFPQRLEPFQLDHTQYEYRLQGDARFHRYCEVYCITSLTATRPGGAARDIAPYFSMDGGGEAGDFFYISRLAEDPSGSVNGTETYVSFLDEAFSLEQTVDEVVGGTAVCTNRWLAEQLRMNDPLWIEGAAPLAGTRIISKPTAHQSPHIIGEQPWALAAQLALNHLSLSDGPQALAALQDILRVHVPAKNTQAQRQIDGLVDLQCERVRHHRNDDAWRGFRSGIRITLTVDHSQFVDSSAVLFGEVLHRFFTLYCPVNMTVELVLRTTEIKEDVKAWPPLSGSQHLV